VPRWCDFNMKKSCQNEAILIKMSWSRANMERLLCYEEVVSYWDDFN